jgi:hypothetical protein
MLITVLGWVFVLGIVAVFAWWMIRKTLRG